MSNTVRGRVAGATRGKLFILIVTNFVDMVGLLMILPLLPYYANELGGGGMEVALLVSSFTAAQLISAPLWGRFSDKHGRKPAMLVGLASAAIAYVVFAFATSLWLLLLSRIVQGAGGGTVGVIQAYVADSTEPQNRAKALGWLSAATNLGVALGPPLGSAALLFGRPGNGLVSSDSAGFYYQPKQNYLGTDQFYYKYCTGNVCDSALVVIAVSEPSGCQFKANNQQHGS